MDIAIFLHRLACRQQVGQTSFAGQSSNARDTCSGQVLIFFFCEQLEQHSTISDSRLPLLLFNRFFIVFKMLPDNDVLF